MENRTKTSALIAEADAKRDFGFDTSQYAIGPLPAPATLTSGNEFGLLLSRAEFRRITKAMFAASDRCQNSGEQIDVRNKTEPNRIEYWALVEHVSRQRGGRHSVSKDRDLEDVNEFIVKIKCSNGRDADMHVRTQSDSNRKFWLNVRANPTSLINGYNAFSVAMDGMSTGAERAYVLSMPFVVLQMLLKSVEPTFDWERPTQQRINKLLFKLCPVQIFTYIDTAPFTPEKFLNYVRAVLASSFGDGKGKYETVGDLLGVSVDAERNDRGVESLLLVFRRDGCAELSVNMYNKAAKARTDARTINAAIGSADTRKYLSSNLRVDITMHAGAIADLFSEARLGNKSGVPLTGANFVRALRNLNNKNGKGGERFIQWLLHYAFEQRLSLMTLLNYQPATLAKAKKALEAYHPDAAAAFVSWEACGFLYRKRTKHGLRSVSFEQYVQTVPKEKLSRAIARKAKLKLLGVGLNPDIPMDAYEVLHAQSYSWDMTRKDRKRYNRALAAGDHATVGKFQQRSRYQSLATIEKLRVGFAPMIAAAHAPAVTVSAVRKQ